MQDSNSLERLVLVTCITGINNRNANCAEGCWTIEAGEEYHSGDEEGDVLAGSKPHYHTDVLREVYCPRKISSPCLKK